MKPFFITTAIDYTNAAPHIGHAYEKVLADVIARYRRLRGDDVFFLTGVDQHGQKVQQTAEKLGVPPQEFVDDVTKKFVALWDKLDVKYDGWAATTDQSHKDAVRAILQRLWDDRDPATGASRWIYKAARSGHYSVRQEQFLTDKERGPDGEFGPEWGEVEFREEENYYFRLTKHESLDIDPKQWLLDFIDKRSADGRPFVVPDFRVSELRNAVEKLDGDLCISRPKSRLAWGIEFPFDPDYVTYVWFDALVNYISFAPGFDPKFKAEQSETACLAPRPIPQAIQNPKFLESWRTAIHVIGKDIMIPAHGVYWPIMLKAIGFTDEDMPTLLVHGWWNISGAKISKSLGNVVDPDALADKYGAAAVRYYLVADIATGKDSDFSEERVVQRYNVDLANGLGNLLNRTLNMVHRYSSGKLRVVDCDQDSHAVLRHTVFESITRYTLAMRDFRVQSATEEFSLLVTAANAFVDQEAPWKLAKDPEMQNRLDSSLYLLAYCLRAAATLLQPFTPEQSKAALDQLRTDPAQLDVVSDFYGANDFPDGHEVSKPVPLFPRIETGDGRLGEASLPTKG